MRADGTCSKIDASVINELKELVMAFKVELDKTEVEYNDARAKHKSAWAYDLQYKLLNAHNEYRTMLDLLLAVLSMYKEPSDEEKAAADAGPPPCPEFVKGNKVGRPHCETWTENVTSPEPTSRLICGVLCRNEEKCVGFNWDEERKSCVWFDGLEPIPGDFPCTQVKETQYVKRPEANRTLNKKIWAAIQRVHVFEEKITSVMKVADLQGNLANNSFVAWNNTPASDEKAELEAKRTFIVAKDNYTATLGDLFELKTNFLNATGDAFNMLEKESIEDPPCGLEFKSTTTTTTTSTTTTTTTLMGTPYPIRWKDFPNGEDTAWSRAHPECPMGTPCFCDCKCRGAPPQNFVEPPPVPPAPCPPPPPTPDPTRMSLPMGAPPALPARFWR